MFSESRRWVKRRQQSTGKGTLEQDFTRVDLCSLHRSIRVEPRKTYFRPLLLQRGREVFLLPFLGKKLIVLF